MKLLIATGVYPPESGGPATYTKLLEDRLPARGVEVAVLPFRTVRHLPPGVRHLAYFWKCFRAARRADIVFAQDTVSVGLPAACAACLARKPFLVRVPGDYAWEQGVQRFGVKESLDAFQQHRYGLRVELLRALQRFTVRQAKCTIVPSRYFGGIVSGWGVRRESLRIIYNGIAIGGEPPAAVEVPAHPCMLSVGRLVPWKGFGMLIELLPTLPEWRLVIVGGGPERARLEALAGERAVESRVRFTGELSHEEVLGYCKAADVFVLNTSFESFSFQIVEAMDMSIPVITTNIGSIPELLQDGEEGVLLAPNDADGFRRAIESVMQQPDIWAARVERASLRAKSFSIDATLDALCELLQTI